MVAHLMIVWMYVKKSPMPIDMTMNNKTVGCSDIRVMLVTENSNESIVWIYLNAYFVMVCASSPFFIIINWSDIVCNQQREWNHNFMLNG